MRTPAFAVLDGTGVRDHHYGKDEHRLREVARINVVRCHRCAISGEHHYDQNHGPEPKHHLHLAQQVPYPGVGGSCVREVFKDLGAKGVHDSNSE